MPRRRRRWRRNPRPAVGHSPRLTRNARSFTEFRQSLHPPGFRFFAVSTRLTSLEFRGHHTQFFGVFGVVESRCGAVVSRTILFDGKDARCYQTTLSRDGRVMDSSPGGTFLRPIGAAKIPRACRKPGGCSTYRARLMGWATESMCFSTPFRGSRRAVTLSLGVIPLHDLGCQHWPKERWQRNRHQRRRRKPKQRGPKRRPLGLRARP